MVPAHVFTDAIKKLPEWDNNPNHFSSVDTVDWRSGFQIVMMWRGNATFQCYLNFGKDHAARDAVMRAAFEQHAPAGKKPKRIACHGYSYLEHEFDSPETLTVNQIAEIAEGLGYKFTVLYVQSCSASRPYLMTWASLYLSGKWAKSGRTGHLFLTARRWGRTCNLCDKLAHRP